MFNRILKQLYIGIMRTAFILLIIGSLSAFSFAQDIDSNTVTFSNNGGVYNSAITLDLSTLGDEIYYTTDGNKPSSSSRKYSTPLNLDKTTPVRAVAYKNGKPGKVITQTFFIGRDYDMAVISITGNPNDFFSFDRGIYVKGCCADSVPPYKHANFWKGWERKVNIEFYEPSGELGFNQQVGTRIFGGFSKGLPMKSLAIISRKKYGQKTMKYPIFPNKDIKKYKSIVLRNSGSDFNNTQFRDALLTNLVEPLDLEIQAYRPSVVYINGVYWGIHNVREKINEYYLKSNGGANPDSVDIMKHRNDLLSGKRDHYLKMKKFINKTDFSDTLEIMQLNTLMDIDNFINYNITEVYVDNRDAGGNIRFWRPQTPEGRWRWVLFDTDISFGISGKTAYKKNTLEKMTIKHNEAWPDPAWSTLIIRNLLENDSIKNVYINRFADHLNTIFSAENVNFKIDSIQNMLKDEMPFHFEKWRSSNLERWGRNVQKMKDFATNRPHFVRMHLMERFDLLDTITVDIQNPDPVMGHVQINSIRVDNSFSGVYFQGAPASIEAKAEFGYEFLRWEGYEQESTAKFLLKDNAILKPVFQKRELSEASSKIIINEISTHQDSVSPQGDWIEIYNNSKDSINVSRWRLIADDDEFLFPDSLIIPSNHYLVISANSEEKKLNNKKAINISIDIKLSSKTERIQILDSDNFVVDSITYNIDAEFPSLVDVENKNIERLNPELNSWKASAKQTPGLENDLFEPIITEGPSKENNYVSLFAGGVIALIVLLMISLIARKRKHLNDDNVHPNEK